MTATREAPSVLQREYYQRLFDLEEKHWWSRGMRQAMRSLLGDFLTDQKRLRVLDAGCGTGYLMSDLEDLVDHDGVFGLDVSLHALRFCKHRGEDRLSCGSASELPFPAASFDLVICIDTIQHLSPLGADAEAFAEFARVLAPGGALYLRTNSSLGHRRLEGVDPNLYRRYRKNQLSKMAITVGLVVDRATYLNFLPSVWASATELFDSSAGQVPPSGPTLTISPPPAKIGFKDRVALQMLRLESLLLEKTRGVVPFGHSLAIVARQPAKPGSVVGE